MKFGILPWLERGHAFTQNIKNHLFCIKIKWAFRIWGPFWRRERVELVAGQLGRVDRVDLEPLEFGRVWLDHRCRMRKRKERTNYCIQHTRFDAWEPPIFIQNLIGWLSDSREPLGARSKIAFPGFRSTSYCPNKRDKTFSETACTFYTIKKLEKITWNVGFRLQTRIDLRSP